MIRDLGTYSARNTSKGALLEEAAQLVGALSSGLALDEVRRQALEGILLRQRTRLTRQTIWRRLHYRLFAHATGWALKALEEACRLGSHSPEFVSLVYLHYALRDRLTFDFVTEVVWQHWMTGVQAVSRDDLLSYLDQAAEAQDQISKWSESSRRKLAASILTALRDFGVLKGTQKKTIVRPSLPPPTAEHLLRILTGEGLRGSEVLSSRAWRLFLLTPDDVAHVISQLAQARRIHFERAGSTVVLDTPAEWSASV
jgi:hypothetical protein